ncbi:MAG: FTR1 family protein [Alphaproteobacteria bacterium]
MLAAAIIVFREVLEAALIVGIVLAASRGIAHRGAWILGGIAAGVVGAVLVAASAGQIQAAVAGMGQEVFNAAVLLTAVAMLGWHNIWMTQHGREMALAANRLGSEVREGARPLWALAMAVGLAVLREGSEIVLFLYGIAATAEGAGGMVLGGALGLAGGAAAGAALYFGLVRIPVRHLFAVTGWMILLLAAGMAAQAAAFLVQADLLPQLGSELWDTSFVLTDDSLAGSVLHTLVGYTAQPSGIQVVFYVATLIVTGGLMLLISQVRGSAVSPGRPQQQSQAGPAE